MDDDLEPIDLSEAIDLGRAAPDGSGPTRPRSAFRVPTRRIVLLVVGAVVGVLGTSGLIAASRSHSRVATASTTLPTRLPTRTTSSGSSPSWRPPAGLASVAPRPFVAVVDDTAVLVGADGTVYRLLADIPGSTVVGASSGGSVLLDYVGGKRIIVGPPLDPRRIALPAAMALLPSADGRWWSTFGPLDAGTGPHRLSFPVATTPIARLRDGYLLVNAAHRALWDWRPGSPLRRLGVGDARVLAVAGDLVAWSDDEGTVSRVVSLTTGRTIDIHSGGFAISARFSPDRSRLAILVSSERDSTVLADASSGQVLARVTTAAPGGGLPTRDGLPVAFQPVPFSWSRNGRQLLVVANVGPGPIIDTIAAADGTLTRSDTGPRGLEELALLTP